MKALRFGPAILIAVAIGPNVAAQEKGGKGEPTDEAIINMIGGRLVKVFAQFGVPEDVAAIRGPEGPETDFVMLDYGSFMFNIRNKTVESCMFWSDWHGKVRGIKFGDTAAQAVKVLGNKYKTENDENGGKRYGWDLKENDAELWVRFDKDGKMKSISIDLK